MKKILIFLSSLSLVSTSSIAVVSCNKKNEVILKDYEVFFGKQWQELLDISEVVNYQILNKVRSNNSKYIQEYLDFAKENTNHQMFLILRSAFYFKLLQFWKFNPGVEISTIPISPNMEFEDLKNAVFTWGVWDIEKCATEETMKIITGVWVKTLIFDIENDGPEN
ncbi:lipoprotein [Spiroplasma alleghenense]|nr:lipoprotein [Spiroplasma alleghenense]